MWEELPYDLLLQDRQISEMDKLRGIERIRDLEQEGTP